MRRHIGIALIVIGVLLFGTGLILWTRSPGPGVEDGEADWIEPAYQMRVAWWFVAGALTAAVGAFLSQRGSVREAVCDINYLSIGRQKTLAMITVVTTLLAVRAIVELWRWLRH